MTIRAEVKPFGEQEENQSDQVEGAANEREGEVWKAGPGAHVRVFGFILDEMGALKVCSRGVT